MVPLGNLVEVGRGRDQFVIGDISGAIATFEATLKAAPAVETRITCRLNLAACHLRDCSAATLERSSLAAIAHCDAALTLLRQQREATADLDAVSSKRSKGLLRRATARLRLVEISASRGVGARGRLVGLARRADLNGRAVRLLNTVGSTHARVQLCDGNSSSNARDFKVSMRNLAFDGSGTLGEKQRSLCLLDLAELARTDDSDAAEVAREMQPRLLPALQRSFFGREVVPTKLAWSQERGRHLVAKRALRRGDIALAADAVAHVGAKETATARSRTSCCNESLLRLVAQARPSPIPPDPQLLRLALAVLGAAAETTADVADLTSQWWLAADTRRAAARRDISLLRGAVDVDGGGGGGNLVASAVASAVGSRSDESLMRLLMQLRLNAFPTEVAGTHGLGVFPAAAYLNHSCAPNASLHCVTAAGLSGTSDEDGSLAIPTLVCRALRPIVFGEEVCISYLGGATMYEATQRRRDLLQQNWGFQCHCVRCVADAKADAKAASAPLAASAAVARFVERLSRGGRARGDALRTLGDDARDDGDAQIIRALLWKQRGDGDAGAMRLRYEVAVAALGACAAEKSAFAGGGSGSGAAALEPSARARLALLAVQSMEALLATPTLPLASAYCAFAVALRTLPPEERSRSSNKQCVEALAAAVKIYTVLLGREHPTTLASRKAHVSSRKGHRNFLVEL